MKLFLASSFRTMLSDEVLRNEFLKFLSKDPKNILIGHIPNAADPKENKSYVKESIDQLTSMGMKIKEIDLRNENGQTIKNKLADCDVIFVNGGNTFYLLDIVRKSGFIKVIGSLLNQGKIYIGASAGSYIACPNIIMAAWKHDIDGHKFRGGDTNIVHMKDFTALNFVPFLISAHFTEEYRPIITKGITETKYPVVALSDTQAVEFENGHYKVVGTGKKEFFNDFRERKI